MSEQQARHEDWCRHWDDGSCTCGAVESEWQKALREDAERYRWLRGKGPAVAQYLEILSLLPVSANWDAAIDAIRKSQE